VSLIEEDIEALLKSRYPYGYVLENEVLTALLIVQDDEPKTMPESPRFPPHSSPQEHESLYHSILSRSRNQRVNSPLIPFQIPIKVLKPHAGNPLSNSLETTSIAASAFSPEPIS
jgi:hypothetical protein